MDDKDKKLVAAALVILFGGNATGLINAYSPDFRADKFTGIEGRELEDRIEILEMGLAGCQRDNFLHREQQATSIATLRAKTISNEYLIKQCMRITGQ